MASITAAALACFSLTVEKRSTVSSGGARLDAVTPMLTQAVEAAAKASAARIARHADAYQGSTAGLAPDQQ